MIDLNYKPKRQDHSWEPEEIAVAVIAVALWIGIAAAFLGAL